MNSKIELQVCDLNDYHDFHTLFCGEIITHDKREFALILPPEGYCVVSTSTLDDDPMQSIFGPTDDLPKTREWLKESSLPKKVVDFLIDRVNEEILERFSDDIETDGPKTKFLN